MLCHFDRSVIKMLGRLPIPEIFSVSTLSSSARAVTNSQGFVVIKKWLSIGKPSIFGQFTFMTGSQIPFTSSKDQNCDELFNNSDSLTPLSGTCSDGVKTRSQDTQSMCKWISSQLHDICKTQLEHSQNNHRKNCERFINWSRQQSSGDQSHNQGNNNNRLPVAMLLSAAATAFNWDDKRIDKSELQETASEINLIKDAARGDGGLMNIDETSEVLDGWEKILDQSNLTIYRRQLSGAEAHLFEYKTIGTFKDIPARAFFNAQLDLDFRKQWDKYLIKLDIVDKDEKSGTEVVHWITHFPYPMYPREYVYLRRSLVDKKQKVMALAARYSEHPKCPQTEKYVRVDSYVSTMVIKPHGSSFDENGFDYILTYHDDPKSNIPTIAYKWMASTGVPDFVEKIHDAAKKLNEKRGRGYQHEGEYSGDTLPM